MPRLPLSLFVSLLLGALYWYAMREIHGIAPFYDEIWKLDVASSGSIFSRVRALHTPLAPGWAALLGICLSWLPGDPITIARFFSAFWILPSVACLQFAGLQFNKSPQRLYGCTLFAAAPFIALCAPVQSAVTYINPYLFEVFYSVGLVTLVLRWETLGTSGRRAALLALAATPLFCISPLFFLPVLSLFLLGKTVRTSWLFPGLASLGFAVASAGYMVLFGYGGGSSANSAALQSFWGSMIVRHSLPRLFEALADFPANLTRSLLPTCFFQLSDRYFVLCVVFFAFLALVGLWTLWKANPIWFVSLFSPGLLAVCAAFFSPWPLAVLTPLNRINLALLWPWYFALALGLAVLIRLLLKLKDPVLLTLLFVLVLTFPVLVTYQVPVDPDRAIYDLIRRTIVHREGRTNHLVPLHYSTVPYVQFLLSNRQPPLFDTIDINQRTSASARLEELPRLAAETGPGRQVYWLVVPHFLHSPELSLALDKLASQGFSITATTRSDSGDILECVHSGGH